MTLKSFQFDLLPDPEKAKEGIVEQLQRLKEEKHALENELSMADYMLCSIRDVLDGKNVSEFAEDIRIVRDIKDLRNEHDAWKGTADRYYAGRKAARERSQFLETTIEDYLPFLEQAFVQVNRHRQTSDDALAAYHRLRNVIAGLKQALGGKDNGAGQEEAQNAS